jgi:hypothetical protein
VKPSDIENGVEVCRLIALLTTGEQESIIIDHESVCVQWFEWVKDDSAWFASRGEALLECLAKAVIRRRRLVICGDFIREDVFRERELLKGSCDG